MIERKFWVEFEALVGKVLAANGYDVTLRTRTPYGPRERIREIDILARNGDVVLPVEVKMTTRETVTLVALRDGSSVAGGLRDFAVNSRPLLIYNAKVDPSRLAWAENEFQIEIWDRERLLERSGEYRQELRQFLLDFARYVPQRPAADVPPVERVGQPTDNGPEPDPLPQGDALIATLSQVVTGNKGAKAYEEVCRDIITYLFGDDLRDVRSQRRTTDGVNIYDLVYRASPKHPFWVTLTRDLRARVVLFECKNYGKPIGAGQVFTTERYLSASAFRPVCFVLTRKPPHRHAVQAASGAMRESGKLLVFLSDEDLIKMLRAKDAQVKEGGSVQDRQENDPTELLDQTIYDFISALPR